MKKFQLILFALIVALVACDEPMVPKPEHLVKEDDMIDMLVDIHLAEATYIKFRYDSIMKDNSSINFYYSVLDKYQVPDSVFERSFVFYASTPKKFDKMYRKVTSRLSQLEQEYSGRKEELLKFEDEPENVRQ